MFIGSIKRKVLKLSRGLELADFSFGLPYTWVLVRDDSGKSALGVAMTLSEEVGRYESSLEEITLPALIERADSLNAIERTLGLAAMNAVCQYHFSLEDAELRDIVEIVPENVERVAVIGNIEPVVEVLRRKGKNVYVFERNPKLWTKDTLSDALEYVLLPEMEAIIASATSLVNGTFDMLIDRSKNAKTFILVGPTGGLLPEFFRDTGVTHVASMKAVDINKALLGLKLGSFKAFERGCVKYVCSP
ncbi:Rossmann-like domain-containing protein [Pyrococcus yayanosii]|uniref:Heavy-metal chelation domain-containing protein n=1 Tax=Pyrococcus yayanosii (strain CH1 / JCM 16557) TaxID=529709 RepID=F8AJF2_PYRYC|nr:DUF364 domain-containing protein [Pyrococcus yayanosii]AEH25018.1 hypothetical protein PYCH_13460 [Pyrococcus yayanosii CH1]